MNEELCQEFSVTQEALPQFFLVANYQDDGVKIYKFQDAIDSLNRDNIKNKSLFSVFYFY